MAPSAPATMTAGAAHGNRWRNASRSWVLGPMNRATSNVARDRNWTTICGSLSRFAGSNTMFSPVRPATAPRPSRRSVGTIVRPASPAPTPHQTRPLGIRARILSHGEHPHRECDRHENRGGQMKLGHPQQSESKTEERERPGHGADTQRRHELERRDTKDDSAKNRVRRVDDVRRDVERPRAEEHPDPEEPSRQVRKPSADVPREQRQRAQREHVQQNVRRLRPRGNPERTTDEQPLHCAWKPCLRVHDVRPVERPRARRVVLSARSDRFETRRRPRSRRPIRTPAVERRRRPGMRLVVEFLRSSISDELAHRFR